MTLNKLNLDITVQNCTKLHHLNKHWSFASIVGVQMRLRCNKDFDGRPQQQPQIAAAAGDVHCTPLQKQPPRQRQAFFSKFHQNPFNTFSDITVT